MTLAPLSNPSRHPSGVTPANALQPGSGSRLSPERHQRAAEPVTYYDQPALKPSFWGWKVSAYIFIGGMSGAAQIIATTADLAGAERYRTVVRDGRFLALAGAALGAPLLIADLHTPQRFYNMLRIFRPTSPLSIGTYVLTGFTALSTALVIAELRQDATAAPTAAERVLEIPAAVTGAVMCTYTGVLLCATSTPLWAAAPRVIPALFGAAAMASAAAALSLAARGDEAERLGRIEAGASAIELLCLGVLRWRLRAQGVRTRIRLVPLMLAAAAPLLHQGAKIIELRPRSDAPNRRPVGAAAEQRSAAFGKAASLAVLAGALLLRHLVLTAGNRSAESPADYFRFAGPR